MAAPQPALPHFSIDGNKKRRPLVAGNWKLNGSRTANTELLSSIRAGVQSGWRCDLMVCPPFVYLGEVSATVGTGWMLVGAQDVSAERSGAFTGEVSATMLRDVGCTHVIVGHSERRSLFGDTDALVAKKFRAAQDAGCARFSASVKLSRSDGVGSRKQW
jgi:triosephosphate isomerase